MVPPPLLRDDPSDRAPIVNPSSLEMPRAASDRYHLLGEIARGGMGVVLKGRDPDIGRDLAVKVLKSEFAGRSAAEQRFVEEAQVGGQLQHPGVVPVYDLGRFGDGRPYFVMKLVKGHTLAELLADRPDPAAGRRVQLLRLRFGEGLPIRAIAERWGVDPAKLHHEYAAARQEFRAALRAVVAFHHPGGTADEIDRACEELLGLLA